MQLGAMAERGCEQYCDAAVGMQHAGITLENSNGATWQRKLRKPRLNPCPIHELEGHPGLA